MSFHENMNVILEELKTTLDKVDEKSIAEAISLIEGADKIFFHALGRSGYAGKSFVMRLMHMGYEVYVMGDTNTPNFGAEDVLIICSGSGETVQFVAMAEKAKKLGGKLLVFTGRPDSTLDKMADASIIIEAPSKNQSECGFSSVQPMASLFEQDILLIGDAMVLSMMEKAGGNDNMFSRHSNLE